MKYETFKVATSHNRKVTVKGRRVRLPHCPDLFCQFFVHPTKGINSDFLFHVSEEATGCRAGAGCTEEAAIHDADENMRLHVPNLERWQYMLESSLAAQHIYGKAEGGQEKD